MKNLLILSAVAITILSSCTDNQRARSFGGTETVELPENRILVNCTWKQDDLWLLTKDTITGKMYFNEKSSWGMMEGEINFK
jgi:hypothetical protein